MSREQVIKLFKMLARSQGMYGRLLEWIEGLDEDYATEWFSQFKGCKSDVDVILMVEG